MNNETENKPIFIRGMSRSGGTLLVTVLDAHPWISMSYELYPTLFDDHLDSNILHQIAEKLMKKNFKKDKFAQTVPAFTKFTSRAERGGIDNATLGTLLFEFLVRHGSITTTEDRLQFIAECCKYKMRRDKKQYWGLKCSNRYQDYLAVWPQAIFLNIIRDGRDVLASQLNTGSFSHTPKELGISWSNTHQKFRELMKQVPNQAFEIKYEDLVRTPEVELLILMQKMGLPFDVALLNHADRDLTLFKSHHLSMEQVKKPINDNKIGRWKKDLTEADLQEFLREAKDTLIEFGYEVQGC
jgi:hypothetical protein